MKQKKKAKQKRKRLAWKDAFKKQLDNLKNRRPQEYPYPQSKKALRNPPYAVQADFFLEIGLWSSNVGKCAFIRGFPIVFVQSLYKFFATTLYNS